jgi:class I fructose-bisphosphate aldolase
MRLTPIVERILENYASENPGVRAKLAQILMHGERLGGSGKLVILPVDQGFEHGPARSFAANSEAYDPLYHYKLAIDAGLSAYAAPLGMLELGAERFAGCIPTILKMNSAISIAPGQDEPDQAVTASVKDALRLGCSAVGFTIYPGSGRAYEMIEEVAELAREAKACGLAVVVWSYPRGAGVSKTGETALDITAYAAHVAALMGANIIKVKPPMDGLEQKAAADVYNTFVIAKNTLSERIAHVMQSSFAGRRIVIFSGGTGKSSADLLYEVRAIRDGGGHGSIIGRNTFQRPYHEALGMLQQIIDAYLER